MFDCFTPLRGLNALIALHPFLCLPNKRENRKIPQPISFPFLFFFFCLWWIFSLISPQSPFLNFPLFLLLTCTSLYVSLDIYPYQKMDSAPELTDPERSNLIRDIMTTTATGDVNAAGWAALWFADIELLRSAAQDRMRTWIIAESLGTENRQIPRALLDCMLMQWNMKASAL